MNGEKLPIYVSLTSIFNNQNRLLQTLQSIIKQKKKPDKIFIYLSEEAYILDNGFKDKKITDLNLLNFINKNTIICIKWVKNNGSYRKLLPLLKDKWEEDCIIITIDDDTIYSDNLIEDLINDYYKHKCVINYRAYTPLCDNLEDFDYHKRKPNNTLALYTFPTGKGGILYKPNFFHKTGNLIFNHEIYSNVCPKQDDIWFYLIRILNNILCYTERKNWQERDISSSGLWHTYNSKNNLNTKAFRNTIEKLKELGYKF